jgi:hypothetical protein
VDDSTTSFYFIILSLFFNIGLLFFAFLILILKDNKGNPIYFKDRKELVLKILEIIKKEEK